MGLSYNAKDSAVQGQQLKVQELVITGQEHSLYAIAGGNLNVLIREQVLRVVEATAYVDSTNTATRHNQSTIVIVDSTAFTAGGDQGAIQITGLAALAANDTVLVRYVCAE